MNDTKAIQAIENESYFITFNSKVDTPTTINILTPEFLKNYIENNALRDTKQLLSKIFGTTVR